jgi:Tfp pilus assembly protein PilV
MFMTGLKAKSAVALRQAGQSLIETIAAIFILSTALTAGLGMAIYALNAADVSQNEVIASNLAREGVDVARMFRDSNWLYGATQGQPVVCADIGNQPCYPNAFTTPNNFNLTTAAAQSNQWRYVFDPSTRTWSKDSSTNYLLCLQPDGTYRHNTATVTCTSAQFGRRIMLSVRTGTAFGYSTTDLDNAEVIIQSIVQWNGKGCPSLTSSTVINNTPAKCKTIVEERLTNWKDYR